MKTALRFLCPILALALAGLTALAEDAPVKITELFKHDHPEVADKVIIVKRIELAPGVSAPPHMHPGLVTGYIESGHLDFQIEGGPLLKLKAGDTFFEPPGSHHLVAKNTDPAARVVIIAFVINPKGAPLSVPLDAPPKP